MDHYRVNQELARDSSKSSLRFDGKSFPRAISANILGHANIDMTQNVPDSLRPCAFVQLTAGTHGAEAPKMPFNARIGRGRVSAKSGCKRSRVKWTGGVYVRNLPSRLLSVPRRGSEDRRE